MSCSFVSGRLQLSRRGHALTPPEAKRFSVWRAGILLLICAVLVGCGGRGMSNGTTPNPTPSPVTTPTSNPTPAPPPTSNPSSSGTPVGLSAGQSVSGIDIVVSAPASATAPNAQDLGVNSPNAQGSASNTGGTIHRGSTMRVLLFGPGLNSSMKIIIGGPNDVTVGNIQGIEATDNTPGIAFTATVAGNAALGARTVYLKDSNGDTTSFTGGLEVIP